jgi:hypothetical protein
MRIVKILVVVGVIIFVALQSLRWYKKQKAAKELNSETTI